MKRFLARWWSRWFGEPGAAAPSEVPEASTSASVSMTGTTQGSMLDCDSVMRQLWDYLDGELTPERMSAIRAHLDVCKRCFPQLEFERSFLDAVAGSAPRHSDPEMLQSRIVERLKASGLTEP